MKDPIGFGGGDTNLYGYVLNDPVNLVDLTGEGGLRSGITRQPPPIRSQVRPRIPNPNNNPLSNLDTAINQWLKLGCNFNSLGVRSRINNILTNRRRTMTVCEVRNTMISFDLDRNSCPNNFQVEISILRNRCFKGETGGKGFERLTNDCIVGEIRGLIPAKCIIGCTK